MTKSNHPKTAIHKKYGELLTEYHDKQKALVLAGGRIKRAREQAAEHREAERQYDTEWRQQLDFDNAKITEDIRETKKDALAERDFAEEVETLANAATPGFIESQYETAELRRQCEMRRTELLSGEVETEFGQAIAGLLQSPVGLRFMSAASEMMEQLRYRHSHNHDLFGEVWHVYGGNPAEAVENYSRLVLGRRLLDQLHEASNGRDQAIRDASKRRAIDEPLPRTQYELEEYSPAGHNRVRREAAQRAENEGSASEQEARADQQRREAEQAAREQALAPNRNA